MSAFGVGTRFGSATMCLAQACGREPQVGRHGQSVSFEYPARSQPELACS